MTERDEVIAAILQRHWRPYLPMNGGEATDLAYRELADYVESHTLSDWAIGIAMAANDQFTPPTKLSDILHLALHMRTPGDLDDRFMCINLDDLGWEGLISPKSRETAVGAVEQLLRELSPPPLPTPVTLRFALIENGCAIGQQLNRVPLDDGGREAAQLTLELTTQFYIWWIFDLRRKGL